MSNRLTESLLKHMNIKSVYYYNSNHADLGGRVDDKFIPEWSKFVAGKNDKPLVANNKLFGCLVFQIEMAHREVKRETFLRILES